MENETTKKQKEIKKLIEKGDGNKSVYFIVRDSHHPAGKSCSSGGTKPGKGRQNEVEYVRPVNPLKR